MQKSRKFFPYAIDDEDSESAVGIEVPFRDCPVPVPVRSEILSSFGCFRLSDVHPRWTAFEQQLCTWYDILTCRIQIWGQFLLFTSLQWAANAIQEQIFLQIAVFLGLLFAVERWTATSDFKFGFFMSKCHIGYKVAVQKLFICDLQKIAGPLFEHFL